MARIAIDVGGTKISGAVVSQMGTIMYKTQETTVKTDTAEDFVKQISDIARTAHAGWSSNERRELLIPKGASIAILGIVNGGYWSAPTLGLKDGENFPLEEKLFYALGPYAKWSSPSRPFIVNDAQAAAWGEYRRGSGQGKDMLFVTVSTGVGGGLVLGGKLIKGKTGLAGHIGHVQIDPNGLECTCGRKGCLQAYVSGEGIALAGQAHQKGVTTKGVFSSAKKGEVWAREILESSAFHLVTAISNVKSMFDIEVAVIGGSVGLAEGYLGMLKRKMLQVPNLYRVEILEAALGEDAGLIGAAEYAVNYKNSFPSAFFP